MNNSTRERVTAILQRARAGDPEALTDLLPLVYDELCSLA